VCRFRHTDSCIVGPLFESHLTSSLKYRSLVVEPKNVRTGVHLRAKLCTDCTRPVLVSSFQVGIIENETHFAIPLVECMNLSDPLIQTSLEGT